MLLGGHVIKVGLGPLVADLVRRGSLTHVAMNGAAAIHDFELAAYRRHQRRRGGGARGRDLRHGGRDRRRDEPRDRRRRRRRARASARGSPAISRARNTNAGPAASVLLACLEHEDAGHRPRGDRRRDHPSASHRRTAPPSAPPVTATSAGWPGACPTCTTAGAVLNWGSAVIMPEVFLKALTIARNLGERQAYRVPGGGLRHAAPLPAAGERGQRPTLAGGTGIQITGHHEILLPLLAGASWTAGRREPGRGGADPRGRPGACGGQPARHRSRPPASLAARTRKPRSAGVIDAGPRGRSQRRETPIAVHPRRHRRDERPEPGRSAPRLAAVATGGRVAVTSSRMEIRQGLAWALVEYRWESATDALVREGRATIVVVARQRDGKPGGSPLHSSSPR